MKFTHSQSLTRSPQYQCTHQVWWKSIDVYSLSPRNENMAVSWADNSVKIWRNLPISNPKPELHNINAHTKFGENPLMFTQVVIRKWKTDGRTTDWRTDRHTDIQHETIMPRHYCVGGYKNVICYSCDWHFKVVLLNPVMSFLWKWCRSGLGKTGKIAGLDRN